MCFVKSFQFIQRKNTIFGLNRLFFQVHNRIMDGILFFTTEETPDIAEAGGKAASLITASQMGYPVPEGFVLLKSFFYPWTEESVSCGSPEGTPFSGEERPVFTVDQKASLEEALIQLPKGAYAVRSSSSEENGEGHSFCGEYATFLGVKKQDLEEKITECYLSWFHSSSQGENPGGEKGLAVIIQVQIPSDFAGLAMSVNPLNNSEDEVFISSSYGLGIGISSGITDPDSYIVDKEKGCILDIHIGKKQRSFCVASCGGTRDYTPEERENSSVSAWEVARISELMKKLEGAFHTPVSAEWAICDGKLWLLQVRPVTDHFQLPLFMMTPRGKDKKLYLNVSFILEGQKNALSFLGEELLDTLGVLLDSQLSGGKIWNELLFLAEGRIWLNLSSLMEFLPPALVLSYLKKIDLRTGEVVEQLTDSEFKPGKKGKKAYLWDLLKKSLIKKYRMALTSPETFLNSALNREEKQKRRYMNICRRYSSLQHLSEKLLSWFITYLVDDGIPILLATERAKMKIRRLFKSEDEALLNALETGLHGDKSVEMGLAMEDLARLAGDLDYDEFMKEIQRGNREYSFAWERLMTLFACRGKDETDPAGSNWMDNPRLLYARIKESSDFSERYEQVLQRGWQTAETLRKAHPLKKKRFEKFYRVLSTFGIYRDTPRYYYSWVTSAVRRRCLDFASVLKGRGIIEKDEDIFSFSSRDIDLLYKYPSHKKEDCVQKLRETHALSAPLVDSRGRFWYSFYLPEPPGEPVSPGIVRGKVKIVSNVLDEDIHKGDILVTSVASPGWNSLFIRASGIILETGSPLQHGAVVAREYGIPCISGISPSEAGLSEGCYIEMDGSTGRITLL